MTVLHDFKAVHLHYASTAEDYGHGAIIFKEYADSLGIDLSFQHFDKELGRLAAEYGSPEGVLLLAKNEQNEVVGCVGVRKLETAIGELKRMYIKPDYRGIGLGRILLQESILAAQKLGYQQLRLDTLSSMNQAIGLYTKMGFYEISPYRYNPIPEARFFEKTL